MRIATSCLVLFALAGTAHAQAADAETLFREGKRLMKKGDIAEACKKFDASERLDPGIGTELNLGNCLEKNHQTASAWAMFVKAAASAKHAGEAKREAEGQKRAAALEKQLVYLTIEVPDDHRVPGLTIKRNELALDETAWGQRTPVDPDDYTITASADGYATWTTHVTVNAKSRRIEVPALDKQAAAPAPEPRSTKPAEEVRLSPSPEYHLRKAPLAIGIVGVAAIGAGVGVGFLSRSDDNASNKTCPTTACSDPHARDLNSRARTEAIAADVGFAVGGLAVATTLIWWYVDGTSWPEHVALAPAVDANHVGLALAGRF